MRTFDELTIPVKRWLSEHLFAQIQMGIATANHRFRLLASTVAAASYSGATCAKFDATVEELGSPLDADSVFLLQFSGNLVCRHPLAHEIGVVWIGFVERYPEGDQPISEIIKREYEPHVQSLQFMLPH
jgi:hypothetical protein